jgi:hypothetical protein
VCVCSLGYPARNAHALLLSSVARPSLQYFSVLSHKLHDFREKKVTEHKMRVLIFPTYMSETFHILRRIQRDAIITAHMSSGKLPVILVKI